jgi:anti-sigma B factor antagonist
VRDEQLILTFEDEADGLRVATLKGVLTISTLFEFQGFVRGDTSRSLIVDMTHITYVDSAGLGSLINAYVSRQRHGKKLSLVGVNERVMTIMRITNVDQFFTMYGTLEEARKAATTG